MPIYHLRHVLGILDIIIFFNLTTICASYFLHKCFPKTLQQALTEDLNIFNIFLFVNSMKYVSTEHSSL